MIRKIDVHILVHQMQDVVLIRTSGVSQIQHRNIVTVIFLGDISIISCHISLCIRIQKRHSGGKRKFNIRIQEIRRLADTCRANHHGMDIAGIDQRGGIFLAAAADNCTLNCGKMFAPSPFLRLVWQKEIRLFDLPLRCPTSRSVLTISDLPCFNTVQAVIIQNVHKNHKSNKKCCHDPKNYHLFFIQTISPFEFEN